MLLSVAAGACILLLLRYPGALRFLRGSLLTDTKVLQLCDKDGNKAMDDREMRLCIEAMLTAITNQTLTYDLDGNHTVHQDDLILLEATFQSFLHALCGNGAIESGEACDDQNTANGDGCSSLCRIEDAFECSGAPRSSCHRICGNGVLNTGEACDDHNPTAGDGCSPACRVELGFSCAGTPSVCMNCGNGIVEGTESCDDGNQESNDSCSNTCRQIVSLAQTCTSTLSPVSLGSATTSIAVAEASTISFRDSAYLVAGNTISRLTKSGSTFSWVQEVRLPNATIVRLQRVGDVLYAILSPWAPTITRTDSMVYRRDASGQWEALGSPFIATSALFSQNAPQILNLLSHDGVLYAVVRNYGNVFKYNNDHTWSSLGGGALDGNAITGGVGGGIALVNSAAWGAGNLLYAVLDVPPTTTLYYSNGTGWNWKNAIMPDHVFQTIELNSQAFVVGISRYTTNYLVYAMNALGAQFLTSVYYAPSPPNFVRADNQLFASNGQNSTVWYDGVTGPFSVRNSNNDPQYTINDGSVLLSVTLDATRKVAAINCKKFIFWVCGDGVVQGSEQCDDANQTNDDRCTNVCRMNDCGDGIVQNNDQSHEQCDDNNRVNDDGCTNRCTLPICLDGIVNQSSEECDDGNSTNTDACTNTCKTPKCGDGVVSAGETCDEGQNPSPPRSGDGCSAVCQIESGYACSGTPSTCSRCGNGVIDAGETCDDHNRLDHDSCPSNCLLPVCGNRRLEEGEECDDGNDDVTDACPSGCKNAFCGDGWPRAGVEQCDNGGQGNNVGGCTSVCTYSPKVCGDGIVQHGEECDDGDDRWKNNAVANYSEADSCTSACKSRTPLPYAFCARNTVYCLNGQTPLCPLTRPSPSCDSSGSARCCGSTGCRQMSNLCEGRPADL